MEKLTYNNVIESIKVIHMSPGGVEYIAHECGMPDKNGNYKMDFESKSSFGNLKDYGYSKEEIKSQIQMYREANRNLNLWKKGLKRVIKMAKKGPGAINQMATAYTGNGPKTEIEYFWTLYRELYDELIEMGKNPNTHPVITHYVDGSTTHTMK